jgi:hypothetical protein
VESFSQQTMVKQGIHSQHLMNIMNLVIYNPGEQADYMYILKTGKLKKETAVSIERANKWPIVINFL